MTTPLSVSDEPASIDGTPKVQLWADFTDQLELFDPESFEETVHVIGLGGIGASLLPILVTMGVRKFVLWDRDLVEPRNIASQLLYKPNDLYRPKVEVCEEYLREYGRPDIEITVMPRFFTEADIVEGVVISGVDTMAARQAIWTAIKNPESDVQFYLDGRIGGLHLTLLSVEPDDPAWYEKRCLFNDTKAAELPCTGGRAIAYVAVVLGGFIASSLANWHGGTMPPKRLECNLGDLFFQLAGVRVPGAKN